MSATREQLEEQETARWMRWLAAPMFMAACFAAAAYGTGIEWFFLPVVLGVLSFPMVIWMLALSTDTVGPALRTSLEAPPERADVQFETAA